MRAISRLVFARRVKISFVRVVKLKAYIVNDAQLKYQKKNSKKKMDVAKEENGERLIK